MPAVIRGKHGGTRALLKGRKSDATRYPLTSPPYGSVTCQLRVVCRYLKGCKGHHGIHYLLSVVHRVKVALKTMLEFLAQAVERRFPVITAIVLPPAG